MSPSVASEPALKPRHTVVVIGGGVAGLTAIKVCQDHGLSAHAFERSDRLGGVWGKTYKNVRLQQRKDDFTLSGTPWPEGTPDFPDAQAVEAYVAAFARAHRLADKVTLNAEVADAAFDDLTNEWTVTLADGRSVRAQHLIVASGALGAPRRGGAAFDAFARFTGEVLHSQDYVDGERFHGKRVLVVGAGSSGVEIAVDLARAADRVTMSVRSDPDWVFPRHGAFGRSLRLCGGGGNAPLWLRNLRARLMFKLKYGALQRYNLEPKNPPLNRRIVVSDEFYPLVSHGAIEVARGGVASVDGDVVTFADGSSGAFDAAVLCTGYDVATKTSHHPYLAKHLGGGDGAGAAEDATLKFYLGCFHPDVPRCAFVGFTFGFAAVPRVAELQAKAAARVILGAETLPDPATQKKRVERTLRHRVQGGNTCVYTSNAYYRRLMCAAGELKSPGMVDASVALKGASLLAGAGALACAGAFGRDADRTRASSVAAIAVGALGALVNRLGRRAKRSARAKDGEGRGEGEVKKTPSGHLGALHTSDSVQSMGSLGRASMSSDTARSDSSAGGQRSHEGSAGPASPTHANALLTKSKSQVRIKAEGTSGAGEKIAETRFRTPKEEVLGAYEKWADSYETDSFDKLGFASPKACVDALLQHCNLRDNKVLDVGAGTGVLGEMIVKARKQTPARMDAMDLTPGMLKHLKNKGVYGDAKAHNMMQLPWPWKSNEYDGVMCNGVLIYVDDPACLDEFVRVTKPGGICVLMFRHDGYPTFRAKDEELRRAGKWELVHKTKDQRNFEKMDFGEQKEDDVVFNQWVFRVLEESPEMPRVDSVQSMGQAVGSSDAGSSANAANAPVPSGMSGAGEKIAGTRFCTPKEEVLDAYEKWADSYETDSFDKLGFASPKACVDALLQHCNLRDNKVLDVGAGTGVLGEMIVKARKQTPARMDAMDLTPGMLKHLKNKGVYGDAKAHNMMQLPWPWKSNEYDGVMCNGVLIYVDDPACLDEFVRVTKPGGICVLMFRHDGYPTFRAKDEELRRAGKWELVHKTKDQRNFEKMESGDDDVMFNQWVFRVLEESPETAANAPVPSGMSEDGAKNTATRFRTPKEEVLGAYEKWADDYDHDCVDKLGFASPKACVDALLQHCDVKGKAVLDVGAGTGLLGEIVADAGATPARMDAMDLTPGMLKHLKNKGMYGDAKAHDVMKVPWPWKSNEYDGVMCNGVLIYVDDPACLDEFVRVTKPGGICVLMFRHDGYPTFRAKDEELRRAGKWELVHKTKDQRNFEKMESGDDDVMFNQWVFRVLEETPA